MADADTLEGTENTDENTQEAPEKFYLGDKEFDTLEDAVRYTQDLEQKLQTNETALGYLQQAVVPREREPARPQEQPETSFSVDENEFFQRPGEVLNKFEERIAKRIEASLNSVREDYSKDQRRRDYWNTFYSENPQFRGFESFVEPILTNNAQTWGNLSLDESRRRLADEANKKMVQIASKFTPHEEGKSTKLLTPGGKQTKVAKKEETEDKVTTLSDVIRKRRHKRMAGNIS